jgi:hypothetical protein
MSTSVTTHYRSDRIGVRVTTQNNESRPEPLETGVDPKQQAASADLVLMPGSEKRSYGSLSEELAIRYMKSGIAAAAIPLLGIYEQRAEQHVAQIDDERKDALQRLSKVEGENKDNAVLIARLRERLTTGGTGRISEQILTTLGAALFGVGVSDLIAPQHHRLANALTIAGAALLLVGWALAIFAIVRNRDIN